MAIKKTTKKAAKKVAAKKKTPAKKAVKKVAVKKSAAKKTPAKKAARKVAKVSKGSSGSDAAAKTTIIANVDVGFGNALYVRGEGAGLSWSKGTMMKNISPYEWRFSTTGATGEVSFKFLINDEAWAEGDNLTVSAGGTSVSSPIFNW